MGRSGGCCLGAFSSIFFTILPTVLSVLSNFARITETGGVVLSFGIFVRIIDDVDWYCYYGFCLAVAVYIEC
jgi:hypothetical protein